MILYKHRLRARKGKNMKILIGADLVPTAYTEKLYVDGDVKTLFGSVADLAKNADRFIVNLECALTDSEGRIKKFGPNLKATPAAVNAIKALGVTDVALSNNHTFDFGIEGLRDTVDTLNAAGLPYMGIGENDTDSRKAYYIEGEGKRIGIINVCEHEYSYAIPGRMGANPFDPFLTMKDIRDARNHCDVLIVLYHGGKEYCSYPSPRLVNMAHEMVWCGADVVITQHSHCVGTYECFEGSHILYGQGNFNFIYPRKEESEEGWFSALLVELEITKTLDIRFYPLAMSDTGCDIAKGDEAKAIMGAFMKRNEEMKNGTWRDGWHAFCTSDKIRNNYVSKIEREFDDDEKRHLFAHFLDCEAHTDVWRELYPTWNMTNEL